MNLLGPLQAQIKLGSGQRMASRGIIGDQIVRGFKTLSAGVLAELVKSDELELMYAHLVSMQNFATVRRSSRNRRGEVWEWHDPRSGAEMKEGSTGGTPLSDQNSQA